MSSKLIEPPATAAGISAESIRAELDRILSSPSFSGAENHIRFLRFVVEETLQGRGNHLKEYLVGVEVFSRGPSFDPRLDSIVRVEARRLRARLAGYYQTAGAARAVVIEFRKGSYSPVFRPVAAEPVFRDSKPRFRLWPGVAVSLVLAAAAYLLVPKRGPAGPSPTSDPSVAVLPFLDMSAARDQGYFCEGIAEEITDALSRLPGLRVAARTSAFEFKGKNVDIREIARRLNVNTLLEGSVRQAGDRLRITAQLINAADGFHIWSETYERGIRDVFAIQDEISQSIVNALKPKFAVPSGLPLLKHYTQDQEAYSLYLKGRYKSVQPKDWAERAIGYFQQAVTKDPNLAPAWAGLAEAQLTLALNNEALPRDKLARAREAAKRALAIDDRLPDAHVWMAYVTWLENWDWLGARREFQRAIELNPSSEDAAIGYALWLAHSGRTDAALEQIERLQVNQPLSLRAASQQASILYFNRQYDRVMEVCKRFVASNPDAKIMNYWLGRALADKSMLPEAIAAMESARGRGYGMLGNLYARAGRREDALRLLDRALHSKDEYVSPVSVAHVYMGLGDRRQALKWLEKGYEDRTFSITTLKVEPAFDSLRTDPAFQSLVTRLHVP